MNTIMLVRFRICLGFLLAVTLVTGCGRRSQRTFEERVILTGTVTMRGNPLPEGQIVFESSEDVVAGIPPGAGQIIGGKYRASVAFGTKTVRVLSRPPSRKASNSDGVPPDDVPPPEYREEGRFVAVIEQDGPRTFDFDVIPKTARPRARRR